MTYNPGDEFKPLLAAVRAFAKQHDFYTAWHPDYKKAPEYKEKILPCYKEGKKRGYWWWRGPKKWGFYLDGRTWPEKDIKGLAGIVPANGEEEIMFFADEEAALALMQDGPRWCQAKRRIQLTDEQRAARAALARKNFHAASR